MQPSSITINGSNYRTFKENDLNYSANSIQTYALRRAFNLIANTSKIIDFIDLPDFWAIDSVYISSPETSEFKIEILDGNNQVFFTDNLLKNELPKSFPTVLINNSIKIRITALRTNIDLLLLYLKPAYLAYSKDF